MPFVIWPPNSLGDPILDPSVPFFDRPVEKVVLTHFVLAASKISRRDFYLFAVATSMAAVVLVLVFVEIGVLDLDLDLDLALVCCLRSFPVRVRIPKLAGWHLVVIAASYTHHLICVFAAAAVVIVFEVCLFVPHG